MLSRDKAHFSESENTSMTTMNKQPYVASISMNQ